MRVKTKSENYMGVRSGAATSRAREMMETLHEARLSDRVRLGVPVPPVQGAPGSPCSLLNRKPSTNPGAEETAFLPDALLRLNNAPARAPHRGVRRDLFGTNRAGLSHGRRGHARGELVGWIELPNSLDPRFLTQAGVDLQGVLWVRPPPPGAALRSAELLLKTGFAVVTLDLEGASQRALGKVGSSVWSRLLRAVRESRATALVMGSERVAGSFATQGLYTERRRAQLRGGTSRDSKTGSPSNATALVRQTEPATFAGSQKVCRLLSGLQLV